MAVLGVLVHLQLAVGGHQPAVGGEGERVDLAGDRIEVQGQPVERLGKRHQGGGETASRLVQRGRVSERREGQLANLEGVRSGEGVGPELGDPLRGCGRHLLDLHPAGGGEDQGQAAAIAVEGDPQVQLVGDLQAGLAPYRADRVATDLHGEDAGRLPVRLVRRGDDRDASRLAPAADRHLGLDRHPAQLTGGSGGLLRGAGQPARGDLDADPGELPLGLVLEKLHDHRVYGGRCAARRHAPRRPAVCARQNGSHPLDGCGSWGGEGRVSPLP